MKTTVIAVMVLGLLLGVCGIVQGAEWVHLLTDDSYNVRYDREGILSPSPGIVRVWVTTVPANEAVRLRQKEIMEDTEEQPGGDYTAYSFDMFLAEINCNTRRHRFLSVAHYDSQGTVLRSRDYSNAEWSQIPPETPADFLYKVVCPTKAKE